MARFRTRARTVDMLGRQQIAGIPNAISELFKNAHDAYADRVEVDYFRSDGLFVLRDDGLGMTKDDFEQRWLTIGTESKVGKAGLTLPPVDPRKPVRAVMGEKGIGRLAIAVIGPQVLILTRAERDGKLDDIVAAFIHWGIFECPGINLDEVEIPVKTFSSLPDNAEISQMVSQVIENLKGLKDQIEDTAFLKMKDELQTFRVNLHDNVFQDLSLQSAKGTQFYILPASENLQAELEIDERPGEISRLKKLLIGFSNTMRDDARPPIKTRFRYWKTDDAPSDYIGDDLFFTPAEFRMADHHIEGNFDEYGHFNGVVTVFDETPVEYTCPWTKALGKPSACGPFKFSLAYVQGQNRNSKLNAEDWVGITNKLDLISGLYIYRDGIRVLPYGDSDFDWLGIEKNRSKSASFYFFSYRRMFGSLDITTKNNHLVEKAGREGFQENNAYRQFQSILKSFFVQLTADFFREGGTYSEPFLETKLRQDAVEKARKAKEKNSKVKREAFSSKLRQLLEGFDNDLPQKSVGKLIGTLRSDILGVNVADPGLGAEELLRIERKFQKDFRQLKEKNTLPLLKGIAFTKQLDTDWQNYLEGRKILEETLFVPEQSRGQEIISEYARKHGLVLDKRKRADQALKDTNTHYQKAVSQEVKAVKEVLNTTQTSISSLTKKIISGTKETVSHIEKRFHTTDLSLMSDEEIHAFRLDLEREVEETAEGGRHLLEHIRTQLQSIHWEKARDGLYIGDAEMNASLEEEVLALRERVDSELEVSQLGMAIEVINHEFESSIKTIRQNLQTLKGWAAINPDFDPLFKNIRNGFDHLDGYLAMFTPLHRRLYRKEIDISGADIAKYLEDIFGERIRRHLISIEASPAFKSKVISGYPSTFYPVFINLVDNAIFWLKTKKDDRLISLDATEKGFLVSDNGPGIPPRRRDAIFQRGYSTKPGGRGLGLYISREVLAKVGYEIQLYQDQGQGTCFSIFIKV